MRIMVSDRDRDRDASSDRDMRNSGMVRVPVRARV